MILLGMYVWVYVVAAMAEVMVMMVMVILAATVLSVTLFHLFPFLDSRHCSFNRVDHLMWPKYNS